MRVYQYAIERLYESLKKEGRQLKGICCIQYPVYCIHATITDVSLDPLDNVDRAIATFFLRNPALTAFQVSSLMGVTKGLVQRRIVEMEVDGILMEQDGKHILTPAGRDIYLNNLLVRERKKSCDWYVDGLTLKPLPRSFYTFQVPRLISENDSINKTFRDGGTGKIYPFGPDLVHTPPHTKTIEEHIFAISDEERESYYIPKGLQKINDISFTRLSMDLLVAISGDGSGLKKELIDGFALHAPEGENYYNVIKRNVRIFEDNVQEKIEKLVFKIMVPRMRFDSPEQPKPVLTTNWSEIDKSHDTKNKCFAFLQDELKALVEQTFEMKSVAGSGIINKEDEISINVTSDMLRESPGRQKLVDALIRQRDYRYGNQNNNAFLIYLHYTTNDEFVKKVAHLRKIILQHKEEISYSWVEKNYPGYAVEYRELLLAADDQRSLEKIDIDRFMIQIN